MSEGIVLSEAFVKNVLPGLRDDYLKIYIYAKFLAAEGSVENKKIALVLGCDENTVDGALCFFRELGLLKESGGKIEFEPDNVQAESDSPPVYNSEEVLNTIADSEELQMLLVTAQKILGRMPSTNSTMILYELYDWLSMPPDLIMRLLEYCAELGKKDLRYVEKVAISWNKMGITSCEMADEYIMRQNKKNKFSYEIKKLFGIEQRNYTPTEQRYVDSWYDMGFSKQLIEYAFDYSVSKTGKLSLPYMNTVLLAWNGEGIKTAEQAQNSVESYNRVKAQKAKKKSEAKNNDNDYEIYNSGRYDFEKIEENARKRISESVKNGRK